MTFEAKKYLLKELFTTKQVGPMSGAPSVVRILVTDSDATDSSSSDEFGRRKYVHHIILERQSVSSKKKKRRPAADKVKKFRGVRKWSVRGKRVWLGTFPTAEAAPKVYDEAAISIIKPPVKDFQPPSLPLDQAFLNDFFDCQPPSPLIWRDEISVSHINTPPAKVEPTEPCKNICDHGGDLTTMDDSLPLDQSFLNDYQFPSLDDINCFAFGTLNRPTIQFEDFGSSQIWDDHLLDFRSQVWDDHLFLMENSNAYSTKLL